jgi:undecaprenyl-diphosphatase
MPLSEIAGDLSALGGIPIYGAITAGLLIAGRLNDAVSLILAFILIYAFVILIRSLWFRPRPKPERYSNFITKFDANSLISIHAARAAILAMFVWTRTDNVMLGAFAALLAVLVASLRIYLKRHYATDVVAGLVIGGIALYAADSLVVPLL